MIGFIQTIQYRIWLPRPSLEELLNYKTFSGFPTLDKIVEETCEPTFGSRLIFLMGNHLNQLPYFFEVLLVQNNHFCHNMNGIQMSCILV